ncbi:alpha/beta hydrolase [Mycobacterium paragordonae]|nr:alpha/beta hydrolase [Mycobacterium paragordonae]
MIEPTPPPFLHDLFGAAHHGFAIEGDQEEIAQCAPALRRLIELLRGAANPVPAVKWAEPAPQWDTAVGRYVRLPIQGVEHRVYIEQAGTGIPVLLQHTAGADGRQWRHLLADPELTQRFRFIAYDLPFHGKSLPPTSTPWWSKPYRLTRDFLMSVPLAVAAALGLSRPVFMGCSIGGHLAVDLAYYHPESFCAVIGLESAARQETELDLSLLDHPRVSNDFKATLMYGLTSPTAPEALRRETAFVYSQGAPPTFRGDLHYWQVEHDLRGLAERIDTTVCAVHLLTGEYDWATPTSLSAQLAQQIPGATFQVMSGLGHFPMSEDPQHFLSYLRPVLDGIAALSTPITRNEESSV